MKKFVRTLNNIYETTKEMKIETLYVNNRKGTPHLIYDDKCTRLDFLGQVVSESDNLDELCDEFVGIGNIYGNKPIYRHYENLYEASKLDDEVYGAIWTDKGLIYVAKMNEKGDLVLI